MSSDERLARLVNEGSRNAFSVIFERYHAPLSRYCRSIVHNPDDSADAFQNTMIAALSGLEHDPPRGALKPWLYRIAHNESINILRRRPPSEDLVADIGELGDAQTQADVGDQLRELFTDLRRLPERQRGALVMRELSGLGYPEIARALNTSTVSARKLVYEARLSLTTLEAGRNACCEEIRLSLSSLDGRNARARKIRAHIDDCAACAGFAAAIDRRHEHLALVPALPAVAAGAMLSGAVGAGHALIDSVVSGRVGRVGGAAAISGAGAAGTGTAVSGLGGALAVKCLAVCGALAVAGTGALVVGQEHSQARRVVAAAVIHHTAGLRIHALLAEAPPTSHAAGLPATVSHASVTRTPGPSVRLTAAVIATKPLSAQAGVSAPSPAPGTGAGSTAVPSATAGTSAAGTTSSTTSTPAPTTSTAAPSAPTQTTLSPPATVPTAPAAPTVSPTEPTFGFGHVGTGSNSPAMGDTNPITAAVSALTSAVEASTSAWSQAAQNLASTLDGAAQATTQAGSPVSTLASQITGALSGALGAQNGPQKSFF